MTSMTGAARAARPVASILAPCAAAGEAHLATARPGAVAPGTSRELIT